MKPAFLTFLALLTCQLIAHAAEASLQAGAAIIDISPTNYPVVVNAMFTERSASQTVDRLEARALVLDDGTNRVAVVVVDTCMMPRDLIDRAKKLASDSTAIPAAQMLVAATHTHSAPAAMGCLGSRADTNYAAFLPGKIAEAIAAANGRMQPARIGWAVVDDWDHTFNRRWIRRPDRMMDDPFGKRTVRAHMHPGHESPDAIGPSGPVDPALSVIAVQTLEGRPLAVLANYSQHYYSSPLLSSDYFGRFNKHIAGLLGASDESFVAMMSQGTSGDLMWMDYGAPRKEIGYDAYAREVAERAYGAYKTIQFRSWVPLKVAQRVMPLKYRIPDLERLDWARKLAEGMAGRLPQSLPEIYALEAIYLHERQETELVLQALRIGDLGITALPNEVYALTGLKLKAQSPLEPTVNIELANGAEGYIPPPEQHQLGGYTTWDARTAGLEVGAEPKIVETLLSLLEEVAGKPRRKVEVTHGAYAKAVLKSVPRAYWRFEEMVAPVARDSSAHQAHGQFENGVALYLPGAGSGEGVSPHPELKPSNFSGPKAINRAAHFAGGRMRAKLPLRGGYTVEIWFWNGLETTARPVTGYMVSRGPANDPEATGDHLGINGTHVPGAAGRLLFFNGNQRNQVLVGRKAIQKRVWHHAALVRAGSKVAVYLDGELDISGEAEAAEQDSDFFIGGRNDGFANFEGKIDEVAVYDRALTPAEIAAHYAAAGMSRTEAANSRTDSSPLSPNESLKKIHMAAGYEVELAAAEPLLMDPVAIDWDTKGRLWVVEMADYPLGMDGQGKPGGRVRMLEDSDGDGRYDRSTLFAEELRFPTGILTWRDGVLITAAPDILFLKDADGDGRADLRKVLFTGFLEGNQQLRINGLRGGLDNWVYCAAGGHYRGYGSAVKVKSLLTGQEIALGSRDFRFRPDTGEFEPVSGPSQFGRNRDDWGHWFGTQNSHPLWHYVLEERYIRRNPHVPAPDPTQQVIVPRNPKVYPASAQEKRFHSFEEAGRFTSACSGMIYRDELLFAAREIHSFTCEPFHNLVHHAIVSHSDVSFTAGRAVGEETSEFFASEDRWCRPVMTRTGPDGALWVVDMYRYMIEHPEWLPENGRAELLPHYREGDDKGRLYRVLRKGEAARPVQELDSLSTEELVAALESSNGWIRDKAQQKLVWENRRSAVPYLSRLAQAGTPHGRLHALWALHGLDSLSPELVEQALTANHSGLRMNALRLAESFTNEKLIAAAVALVRDEDPKVRLQLACSLGEWREPRAAEALVVLAKQDYGNSFMRAAIMSSAVFHAQPFAIALVETGGAPLQVFREPLWMVALGTNNRSMLRTLLRTTLEPSNGKFTREQMEEFATFLQLLQRRNVSEADLFRENADESTALPGAEQMFAFAQKVAIESNRSEAERFSAATLLVRSTRHRKEGISLLAKWITPRTSLERQGSAITVLGESGDSRVPELLLNAWAEYGPEARARILDQMLQRESWTILLLQRAGEGHIAASAFDAARSDRLLRHQNKQVRELAEKLFKHSGTLARGSVVEQYRPALALAGDSARGAKVFERACLSCHTPGANGTEIGPDLRSVSQHSPEKLLVNIIDPNVDVQPGFHAYTVQLETGEDLYGIIAAETANSLILKSPDGVTRTISRSEIRAIRSSNLSLMPEGLESGMELQDMADLLAFLRTGLVSTARGGE